MRSLTAKLIGGKLFFNELSMQRFNQVNNGRWCDIIARVPLRSLTQNRYYWLYLTIVSDETGNNIDELHELFKRKFLPVVPTVLTMRDGSQHTFERLTSTTRLGKVEFGEYLDKICAMTGVPLPDPQAAGYLPR